MIYIAKNLTNVLGLDLFAAVEQIYQTAGYRTHPWVATWYRAHEGTTPVAFGTMIQGSASYNHIRLVFSILGSCSSRIVRALPLLLVGGPFMIYISHELDGTCSNVESIDNYGHPAVRMSFMDDICHVSVWR